MGLEEDDHTRKEEYERRTIMQQASLQEKEKLIKAQNGTDRDATSWERDGANK